MRRLRQGSTTQSTPLPGSGTQRPPEQTKPRTLAEIPGDARYPAANGETGRAASKGGMCAAAVECSCPRALPERFLEDWQVQTLWRFIVSSRRPNDPLDRDLLQWHARHD